MKFSCPRCKTVVEAPSGAGLVCPSCGFGAKPGSPPPPRPAAPPPASTPTWGSPPAPPSPASGWGVPASAPPQGQPPFQPVPDWAMAPQQPMILANKVGRQRTLGMDLLLVIVTFGIYGLYWNYKAHAEVYKQFDLAREGKDEGMVWFILGIVLIQPLFWVYQHGFIKNINFVRERLGLPKKVTTGKFLGLVITGAILFAVGIAMAFLGAVASSVHAGDILQRSDGSSHVVTPTEAERANSLGHVLLPIGIVALLGGLAMEIGGYAMLQKTINGIWDAYDARMGQLSGAAPRYPS